MKEYLIVDAYNIINAWDILKSESAFSLESSRTKLLDIMSDYQAYKGINVIVVFDAHYVKKNVGKQEKYNAIEVVYTKEFESADNYIERLIGKMSNREKIRVATSDWVEQLIVLGYGAVRMSARELWEEIKESKVVMDKKYINKLEHKENKMAASLNSDIVEKLEKMRRGNNKLD